jgi:hypothetical protein
LFEGINILSDYLAIPLPNSGSKDLHSILFKSLVEGMKESGVIDNLQLPFLNGCMHCCSLYCRDGEVQSIEIIRDGEVQSTEIIRDGEVQSTEIIRDGEVQTTEIIRDGEVQSTEIIRDGEVRLER